MAVELGSGYDNPAFKAQKVTDANVSSGFIYENFQSPEKNKQQKPKPNSDATPREAAAMMPNVKVHLVLVLLGIVSVLLLVCIGFFSWGGWKMTQLDEAAKKHSEEMADLKTENEKSHNETERLNQTIQVIQKINTFVFDEHCNGRECLLCHVGWILFNESCYISSNVSFTWDESRRFCQYKFADLVVIDSLEEQIFIYDNIKSWTWLGLQRNGSDWVWIAGRIDTLKYWCPSCPNNYYYYSPYAFMYRMGDPTKSWDSAPSNYRRYAMCEQKAFKVSLD